MAFVQQLKKSLSQNEIHVLFLFSVAPVLGMAPSDCNTILTRGFSPPPNLISSGFSNNTKDECHVSRPYLGLHKATLRGEE